MSQFDMGPCATVPRGCVGAGVFLRTMAHQHGPSSRAYMQVSIYATHKNTPSQNESVLHSTSPARLPDSPQLLQRRKRSAGHSGEGQRLQPVAARIWPFRRFYRNIITCTHCCSPPSPPPPVLKGTLVAVETEAQVHQLHFQLSLTHSSCSAPSCGSLKPSDTGGRSSPQCYGEPH